MGELILTVIWLPISFAILFTGDLVLLIFSFGQYKPTWSRFKESAGVGGQIFSEVTFWIGTATWIAAFILFSKIANN